MNKAKNKLNYFDFVKDEYDDSDPPHVPVPKWLAMKTSTENCKAGSTIKKSGWQVGTYTGGAWQVEACSDSNANDRNPFKIGDNKYLRKNSKGDIVQSTFKCDGHTLSCPTGLGYLCTEAGTAPGDLPDAGGTLYISEYPDGKGGVQLQCSNVHDQPTKYDCDIISGTCKFNKKGAYITDECNQACNKTDCKTYNASTGEYNLKGTFWPDPCTVTGADFYLNHLSNASVNLILHGPLPLCSYSDAFAHLAVKAASGDGQNTTSTLIALHDGAANHWGTGYSDFDETEADYTKWNSSLSEKQQAGFTWTHPSWYAGGGAGYNIPKFTPNNVSWNDSSLSEIFSISSNYETGVCKGQVGSFDIPLTPFRYLTAHCDWCFSSHCTCDIAPLSWGQYGGYRTIDKNNYLDFLDDNIVSSQVQWIFKQKKNNDRDGKIIGYYIYSAAKNKYLAAKKNADPLDLDIVLINEADLPGGDPDLPFDITKSNNYFPLWGFHTDQDHPASAPKCSNKETSGDKLIYLVNLNDNINNFDNAQYTSITEFYVFWKVGAINGILTWTNATFNKGWSGPASHYIKPTLINFYKTHQGGETTGWQWRDYDISSTSIDNNSNKFYSYVTRYCTGPQLPIGSELRTGIQPYNDGNWSCSAGTNNTDINKCKKAVANIGGSFMEELKNDPNWINGCFQWHKNSGTVGSSNNYYYNNRPGKKIGNKGGNAVCN